MNKDILIDVGSQLSRLRMYPLFDACHYLLTAMHVRDEIQQYQTGKKFRGKSLPMTFATTDKSSLSILFLITCNDRHSCLVEFSSCGGEKRILSMSIVDLATQNFTRRHPLSCWLSTMLLCFSGTILANFLLGESLIKDFLHYQHLLLATVCWYLVFYSPLDLLDRFIRFLPIRLVIGVAKEIQRTKKIYMGVHSTLVLYPDAYIIVVLIGAIKGRNT